MRVLVFFGLVLTTTVAVYKPIGKHSSAVYNYEDTTDVPEYELKIQKVKGAFDKLSAIVRNRNRENVSTDADATTEKQYYGITHYYPWKNVERWGPKNFSDLDYKMVGKGFRGFNFPDQGEKRHILTTSIPYLRTETPRSNVPRISPAITTPSFGLEPWDMPSTKRPKVVKFSPAIYSNLFIGLNAALVCLGIFLNTIFAWLHIYEEKFFNLGTVFVVNMGAANMFATNGMLGFSWVLMSFSGAAISTGCKTMWFFAFTSIYNIFLAHMIAALELVLRSKRLALNWTTNATFNYGVGLLFLIWLLSVTGAHVGVNLDFEYDYCERKSNGNLTFRITAAIFFIIIPTSVVFFVYSKMFSEFHEARRSIFYRPSIEFRHRYDLAFSHFINFMILFLCYTAFEGTVLFHAKASPIMFYNFAWGSLVYFLFAPLSYVFSNELYRGAFLTTMAKLLCRNTLNFEVPRERLESEDSNLRQIRVHVIDPPEAFRTAAVQDDEDETETRV